LRTERKRSALRSHGSGRGKKGKNASNKKKPNETNALSQPQGGRLNGMGEEGKKKNQITYEEKTEQGHGPVKSGLSKKGSRSTHRKTQ